jgi:hypothetical protein
MSVRKVSPAVSNPVTDEEASVRTTNCDNEEESHKSAKSRVVKFTQCLMEMKTYM